MKKGRQAACCVFASLLIFTGCAGDSIGNTEDQTRQSETEQGSLMSSETEASSSEHGETPASEASAEDVMASGSVENPTEDVTASGSTEDSFADQRYTGVLDAWQVTGPPDLDGIYYEPYYIPLEADVDLKLYCERSLDAGTVIMPEGSIFFAEARDGKEWIFFREMNDACEGWLHITEAPHTYQFVDANGNRHDIYEAFAEDEKVVCTSQKCESDIGELLEKAENCGPYYRIGFSTAGEVSQFLRDYKKMLPLSLTKAMESWFDRDQTTKYLFFYQTDCSGEIITDYSMKTGTLYIFSADGGKEEAASWYVSTWEKGEELKIEHIIEYSRNGLISCR